MMRRSALERPTARRRRQRLLALAPVVALAVGVLVAAASAGQLRLGRSVAACPMDKLITYNNPGSTMSILPADCYYQSVPRAKCGAGSTPETGFQGEVPLALRNGNFKGFNCNLQLVGHWQGQGASWQLTWYGRCAYYDQALPGKPGETGNNIDKGTFVGTPLVHPGAVAVDVKNPTHPRPTAYLATPGMIHPWESLKANPRTALLAGQVQGAASLDVYSIAKDCAHPKLLSSTPFPDFGHEGEWSPDGKTYWADYGANLEYHAFDTSEPTHPTEVVEWKTSNQTRGHGLAISNDGKTAYFTANGATKDSSTKATAGFMIADVSDVQLRRPNPQIHVLSTVNYIDGYATQMQIPFTEHGHPYMVQVDELGSEGLGNATNWQKACTDGLPPFGIARIFDIGDPSRPTLVSRLTLQTDKPSNCQTAVNDAIKGGQTIFSYDSHYCSIDRRTNATALACGYFNSGVRVFDVRNPAKPREIAYYVPPSAQAKTSYLAGSEHAGVETGAKLTDNGLSADWCSAQSRFYQSHGTYYLWISCQDNGFQVLKFTDNAYPLTK